MLLLMPIKVLARDYEFENRPDSFLSSKPIPYMVLQDKLFSGTHNKTHNSNGFKFYSVKYYSNFTLASHRKGRMSTENDTNLILGSAS